MKPGAVCMAAGTVGYGGTLPTAESLYADGEVPLRWLRKASTRAWISLYVSH